MKLLGNRFDSFQGRFSFCEMGSLFSGSEDAFGLGGGVQPSGCNNDRCEQDELEDDLKRHD